MIDLTGWLFEQETDEQLRIVEYLIDVVSEKYHQEINLQKSTGEHSNHINDVAYYFRPTGFQLRLFGEKTTLSYMKGNIYLVREFYRGDELEKFVRQFFEEIDSLEEKHLQLESILQQIKQQGVDYFSRNTGYRIGEIKEKSFNVFVVDTKTILGRDQDTQAPSDMQYQLKFKSNPKEEKIVCSIEVTWHGGWGSYRNELSFDYDETKWSFKQRFETSSFLDGLERKLQVYEF